MVKIRLARLGRKKRPFYRVVAINSRSARDGKFLDILGTYDPLQEPSVIKLDNEKIKEWRKRKSIEITLKNRPEILKK